ASPSRLAGARAGAGRSDASGTVISGPRSAGRLASISLSGHVVCACRPDNRAAFPFRAQQSEITRRPSMRAAFFYLALVAACASLAAAPAQAHPHVWVTMTEELLYAPD